MRAVSSIRPIRTSGVDLVDGRWAIQSLRHLIPVLLSWGSPTLARPARRYSRLPLASAASQREVQSYRGWEERPAKVTSPTATVAAKISAVATACVTASEVIVRVALVRTTPSEFAVLDSANTSVF